MMPRKADFEELFPEKPKPSRGGSPPQQLPSWIVRWEDDGGRNTSMLRKGPSTLLAR